MLSLKIATGETVMIGDDIIITVIRADHGIAKLSFDAPREIPINREEVYNRMKKDEANDKSDHQRKLDPRTRQKKHRTSDV